ncbi:SART-1 protein [Ascodesmis nigricans]|uniref:SART-1 protein n=1 Tax=Ascodesmis nigricans TaxID=341454 RepID=A0A4S2N6U7_9PEZI|nr:SART-1 protein [Ascodesmis nigricans]
MANESELSIEETNKLRISLGLKPLKVDNPPSTAADADSKGPKVYDDTTEGRERQAVDNWKAHEAAAAKDEARRRRAEEIRRAREQAQRFRKLEGKGLADDDEDEDMQDAGADAATWLKKQKKRQRKMAEKLARQKEEELEREARERREYTEKDLAGVKVGHDLTDIGDFGGDEVVLTLKDTTIDENEAEGDELISTDLAERERLKERLELKKKKPAYNPYEEAEGGESRILAQYDDDDDKKKKRFVLDGTGSLANNETYRQEVAEKLKATAITLDIPKPEVTSDYIDPSTIKVKKPKKKKAKSMRKRGDEEDALNPSAGTPNGDNDEMDIDQKPAVIPRKRIAEDSSFIDDDDLQSALARQRRTALKKRKILRPDEIARQLREETENGMEDDAAEDGEPGLVIDETTEFVSNLRERTSPKRPTRPRSVSAAPIPEADKMQDVKGEDEDGDIAMGERPRSRSISVKPEFSPPPDVPTTTGLDEEATITGGVGATVAMLTKRGLLSRDPSASEKLLLERERNLFLLNKRESEMLSTKRAKDARAHDRESGKFDRMSAREREEHARRENKHRDFVEARQMAERFKDYKPNVELHYTDEFGREMSQKEAFKYLSHQFHGKGSGKLKTEKRLKKIEDEKKREAASHLGTGESGSAVQTAAKKSKQAGVRLM